MRQRAGKVLGASSPRGAQHWGRGLCQQPAGTPGPSRALSALNCGPLLTPCLTPAKMGCREHSPATQGLEF